MYILNYILEHPLTTINPPEAEQAEQIHQCVEHSLAMFVFLLLVGFINARRADGAYFRNGLF